MTTTAEKIKVMQAFEDGAKVQSKFKYSDDYLNYFQKDRCPPPAWNWEERDYRIKPANQKPLECWVNMYNDLSGDTYATATEALLNLRESHEYRQIHMREVTPQDEQDRLKFRENTCNDALNYPPN